MTAHPSSDPQALDPSIPDPRHADTSATDTTPAVEAGPVRVLSAAAERALAEAAERRAALDAQAKALSAVPERDGRGGLEPVRYGDWEIKGLASDF